MPASRATWSTRANTIGDPGLAKGEAMVLFYPIVTVCVNRMAARVIQAESGGPVVWLDPQRPDGGKGEAGCNHTAISGGSR
jgi:hypothetical protein